MCADRPNRAVRERQQEIVYQCVGAGVVRDPDADTPLAWIDRDLTIGERRPKSSLPRTQVLAANGPKTRSRRVRPNLVRKLGLREVELQSDIRRGGGRI